MRQRRLRHDRAIAADQRRQAAPGSKHVLEAHIQGDNLVATIDGNEAWVGTLPAAARGLHGPLGVRTDNVEADLALVGTAGSTGDDAARCRQGGGGD